jgi:hypothetical protein
MIRIAITAEAFEAIRRDAAGTQGLAASNHVGTSLTGKGA